MNVMHKLDRDTFFNNLRENEYSRLDQTGHVYLDYTGGNIHPKSLVEKHVAYLQKEVYGNPHSINPSSLLSDKHVNHAREKVLNFFNANDYYCVFTNNATGALQIVGENYPFCNESHFLLTDDNHNSVNGIREYCRSKGGDYTYSIMNPQDLSIHEPQLYKNLISHPDKKDKLFAFPAQSNASGVQHSLKWIDKAHEQGWDVLLDAAAFVPTSRLNLSTHRADFVSMSFYKIFGYPTGIGCLLIHKSKFNKLKKSVFAGGTVSVVANTYSAYFLKPDYEKFESGTLNYLAIPAISQGLDFISAIGMENISQRIKDLSAVLLSGFKQLIHNNGLPLIKLYGPKGQEKRGGTFLVNFFDEDGQPFSLHEIIQRATDELISLRTGCFCNPGIDELNHSLSADELRNYFNSRDHGAYEDMISFLNRMRGAVRISVGIPTTEHDLEKFKNFARSFLNQKVEKTAATLTIL